MKLSVHTHTWYPLCFILALGTCAPIAAQDPGERNMTQEKAVMLDTPEPVPVDPDVRIGTLSNGLRYYLKHNEKPEDKAELRLAVAAGSTSEDDDQLGLAHFVEHMAFNGSENFSKNELVDYLESVGTRFGPDLNAYTSFDETVYMLQVRTDDAEHLDQGLTVLEDWAGGLSFDHEEIDKERGVVISEWRTRLSARQRMQQVYFPLIYKGSRYAKRLPIGDPEIVQNAEYETIKRFYHDWYRPDLMAVVIVGDIDPDAMEEEVKTRFSGLRNPADPRPKQTFSVPYHEDTEVCIVTDKEASFTNVRVLYKHRSNPERSLQTYRQGMVRSLYNRMLNARLREVNQVADPPFVYAFSGYYKDVGDIDMYSASAMVPENKIEHAFAVLLTENRRVYLHGFVQSELDRQKEELLKSAERQVKEKDKTESSRLASDYVYHFLEQDPIPSPVQNLELVKQFLPEISLGEINALARKWIRDENRFILLTAPEKEGLELPSKERLLQIAANVSELTVDPYEDDVSDAPLFADPLEPRDITERSEIEEVGVRKIVLENGVTVEYKQTDFKNDEILVTARSWGGSSLYPDALYKQARAVNQVIGESGVAEFDDTQLNKKLTGKRIYISPFVGERYEGFNGSCSPDDLETLFQLIYLYMTNPRRDPVALSAYQTKQRAIYENLLSNPANYFYEVMTKIRYQDHPRRGLPKREDLEDLSLDQIMEIYRDRMSDASDFTFFFTGAFEEDALITYAQKYLGNIPSSGRSETWKDVGVRIAPGRIDTTIYRGEAPRSNVEIMYHGPFEWAYWNRFEFQAMVDLLRIKMREELREDRGGVYGVRIYGSPSKEPVEEYRLSISFNSDPPRTEELIQATKKVIRRIAEEGVAEEDMQKIKETMRQSRLKNLRRNRYWQSAMVRSWTQDGDITNITMEALERNLKKLKARDLQEAVGKYFNEDQCITGILHPEEAAMR